MKNHILDRVWIFFYNKDVKKKIFAGIAYVHTISAECPLNVW
jgi:hypothetical protein